MTAVPANKRRGAFETQTQRRSSEAETGVPVYRPRTTKDCLEPPEATGGNKSTGQ